MLIPLLALLVAAAPTPTVQTGAGGNDISREKMICKRMQRTGSLIATQRVCKTQAVWDRDRELLRERTGAVSCSIQPCTAPGK